LFGSGRVLAGPSIVWAGFWPGVRIHSPRWPIARLGEKGRVNSSREVLRKLEPYAGIYTSKEQLTHNPTIEYGIIPEVYHPTPSAPEPPPRPHHTGPLDRQELTVRT